MIKPEELRIGSYFISNKWNVPGQLTIEDMLDLYGVADGAKLDESHINQLLSPIPLSLEWESKLGIDWKYIQGETKPRRFLEGLELPEFIEKVHQVQNYHFGLYGKELELKQ